jgi:uncharacterized membrane protein YagU involved in acid resistance
MLKVGWKQSENFPLQILLQYYCFFDIYNNLLKHFTFSIVTNLIFALIFRKRTTISL